MERQPDFQVKKQERLKGFFHFCVAREWMRTNPVAALKPIKVPSSQTLPFDEDQVTAILDACDRYPLKGIYGDQNRSRLKALTLLMRYSGLRIGDRAKTSDFRGAEIGRHLEKRRVLESSRGSTLN